jgi:uncharacterized membrane protein
VQRRLAAALTVGALLWAATLLLAPLALQRGRGVSTASALIYQGASLICHQRPERSFHLAGVQLPVCARCTGLYISGAAAALAACSGRRRRINAPRATRMVFAVAAVPTALTLALEIAALAQPSNTARAIAALPLGAAAGWIFVRSLRAEADLRA